MSIYWKHLFVGLAFALTIFVFGFDIGYAKEKGSIVCWSVGALE